MHHSILHLDVDAFFASIEQRDDPRLRGRPVAVGTGVVASCSYEARGHGVHTGMRLALARRLCRELVVLPGAYPRYEQAARQILAICQDHTPQVEAAALDDLYLDLSQPGLEVGAPEVRRVADEVRRAVDEEIHVGISMGIGSNKLVARVATREAKPGRSVLVPAGTERDYLGPWPAEVLPGVGPKVLARLERLNIQRVREVAAVPPLTMQGLFGPHGKKLHQLAHGIDPRPVQPQRPQQSVSRSTSFEPALADRAFLKAMLAYLLERACSWLRFKGQATRGLTLTIRYGDYKGDSARESFRQATDDEKLLIEAARERFERLYHRRLPLRYLGVELSPLGPCDTGLSLFTDEDEEKQRRLRAAKDAVRRRFGFTSLLSGTALLLQDSLERDRENFRLRTPCLTR